MNQPDGVSGRSSESLVFGSHDNDVSMTDSIPLSDEVWLHIFSILGSIGSVKDVASLGLTCRQLNHISKDSMLWNFLYRTHFPLSVVNHPPLAPSRCLSLYKDNCILRRKIQCHSTGSMSKEYYQDHQFREKGPARAIRVHGNLLYVSIENNSSSFEGWSVFNMASGKKLCGSDYEVFPRTVHVCGSYLYLINLRDAIKLDMHSGEQQQIKFPDGSFSTSSHVASAENQVCRIMKYGILQVLDLDTGKIIKEFSSQAKWIGVPKERQKGQPFAIEGNYLHRSLRTSVHTLSDEIWALDLTSKSKKGDIKEIKHNLTIMSYKIHEDQLIFSDGTRIQFWDLKSKSCIRQMNGRVELNSNQFLSRHIDVIGKCLSLTSSTPKFVTNVWDIENLEDIKRIQCGDGGTVTALRQWLIGNSLYVLLSNQTMQVMDLTTKTSQILELNEQQIKNIRSFQGVEKLVIIFSDACSISIWNRETGECLHKFNTKLDFIDQEGRFPLECVGFFDKYLFLHTGGGSRNIVALDVTTGEALVCWRIVAPLSELIVKAIGERLILVSKTQPFIAVNDYGNGLEFDLEILDQLALAFTSKPDDKDGQPLIASSDEGLARLFRQLSFNYRKSLLGDHVEIYLLIDLKPIKQFRENPENAALAITRLQAEVCVGILLRAVQDGQSARVRVMLDKLKNIDPALIDRLHCFLQAERSESLTSEENRPSSPLLSLQEIREAAAEVRGVSERDEKERAESAICYDKGFDATPENMLAALSKLMMFLRDPSEL